MSGEGVDDVLIAETRDQLREQGLDDESISESIAAMREQGMFTVPGMERQ